MSQAPRLCTTTSMNEGHKTPFPVHSLCCVLGEDEISVSCPGRHAYHLLPRVLAMTDSMCLLPVFLPRVTFGHGILPCLRHKVRVHQVCLQGRIAQAGCVRAEEIVFPLSQGGSDEWDSSLGNGVPPTRSRCHGILQQLRSNIMIQSVCLLKP